MFYQVWTEHFAFLWVIDKSRVSVARRDHVNLDKVHHDLKDPCLMVQLEAMLPILVIEEHELGYGNHETGIRCVQSWQQQDWDVGHQKANDNDCVAKAKDIVSEHETTQGRPNLSQCRIPDQTCDEAGSCQRQDQSEADRHRKVQLCYLLDNLGWLVNQVDLTAVLSEQGLLQLS